MAAGTPPRGEAERGDVDRLGLARPRLLDDGGVPWAPPGDSVRCVATSGAPDDWEEPAAPTSGIEWRLQLRAAPTAPRNRAPSRGFGEGTTAVLFAELSEKVAFLGPPRDCIAGRIQWPKRWHIYLAELWMLTPVPRTQCALPLFATLRPGTPPSISHFTLPSNLPSAWSPCHRSQLVPIAFLRPAVASSSFASTPSGSFIFAAATFFSTCGSGHAVATG